MSRALRRTQKSQEPANDENSSEDDSPIGGAGGHFGNAFSMLTVEEYDHVEENSSSESEGEPKSVTPPSISNPSPAFKKKQKKNKKKKPNKNSTSPKQEMNEPNDKKHDEPVDKYLTVDAPKLSMEMELKRIFGSATLKSMSNSAQNKKSTRFPGRFLLCQPNDYWPKMDRLGLSMEYTSQGNCFRFQHSKDYQSLERQFLDLVALMAPEALMQFQAQFAGHAGCQVLLSYISTQTGDANMASEYLARAFFTFEKAFDIKFKFTSGSTGVSSRLDYFYYENRSFYLALFHHVALLQRRGCWCTAFEVCKSMLRLDSRGDPLGGWLLLDFLALRAGEYQTVMDIYKSLKVDGHYAARFPNWMFSSAVACFFVHGAGAESFRLMDDARLEFPDVFNAVLNEAGVSFTLSDNVGQHTANDEEEEDTQKRHENLLNELYVLRSSSVWKQPEVVAWLKQYQLQANPSNTQSQLNKKHDANVQLAHFRHAYLVDWTNSTTQAAASSSLTKHIPEILTGGAQELTPWGSEQLSILDPLPPCTHKSSGHDETEIEWAISPYEKYYVRRLVRKYPHASISALLTSRCAKGKSTQQLMKYFEIGREDVPPDVLLMGNNNSVTNANGNGGWWDSIVTAANNFLGPPRDYYAGDLTDDMISFLKLQQ